ncbi:hypothetical protein [Klebsiella pneumoniae ISC21]|nr:hypothetical protein [Klebsiella pneumoniae ISC21]
MSLGLCCLWQGWESSLRNFFKWQKIIPTQCFFTILINNSE